KSIYAYKSNYHHPSVIKLYYLANRLYNNMDSPTAWNINDERKRNLLRLNGDKHIMTYA
ncbi:16488_t:CDS:1, partial [Funneliformis mosseae]